MVSVTADQIRKRLGLTSQDISDEDVLAFRDEVVAFLSEEIGRTINVESYTQAEANAIRNLAAIYCYCHVTGGSALGLNFHVGDLGVSESAVKQIEFLKQQIERFIAREKRFGISLQEGP
ncbi:hypothetical protein COZ60_01785 [Candidatus Bathyarchaeota archaeon CG_4_8_14_3_um_filter_42_8]|nr:MAG: hypothetical protein COZ60_01785 [Candidatus Bathyarchaeota archaeon CG_4_8_14_3_um_filter_42_8]